MEREARTEETNEQDEIAIVLTGAAARGGFQAGALATVLRHLQARGERPSIVLGTSAGAINAALYASFADLCLAQAGERVLDVWRRMGNSHVYSPLGPTLVRTGLGFGAGALAGAGGGTESLLDTTPLARTARTELDEARLERNVAEGHIERVGVVATRLPSTQRDGPGTSHSRSVVFLHEQTESELRRDKERNVDVARTPLLREHVLASAAIPIGFPPQRITTPGEYAGWYVDGGVRLNAPLRPVVHLDATRIFVISATSEKERAQLRADTGSRAPDVADAGAQVLNAVLSDRLAEDVIAIERINHLLSQLEGTGLKDRHDERSYRPIELTMIAPQPGVLGSLADDVLHDRARCFGLLHDRTSWVERLRTGDNQLLGRLLRGAGDGAGRRELLSYLLFDREYFDRSIDLGEHAARAALGADRASADRGDSLIGGC